MSFCHILFTLCLRLTYPNTHNDYANQSDNIKDENFCFWFLYAQYKYYYLLCVIECTDNILILDKHAETDILILGRELRYYTDPRESTQTLHWSEAEHPNTTLIHDRTPRCYTDPKTSTWMLHLSKTKVLIHM